MAASAETANPRVEIDTSPPFESVKEAVDRFGGSGPWIPQHLLRLPNDHHASDGFDVERMREQATELERNLIMKQQQTLGVFKQLQDSKRLLEALKLNQDSSCMSPGFMFVELNQAKLNLEKTSMDLAEIQATVESLNVKIRKDKHLWCSRKANIVAKKTETSTSMSSEVKFDFEAQQLKKMTEGSRYEVIKAMAEIERTKHSIKMAEMRLKAAKKMEEAAKVLEAISIAENERNESHFEDVCLNNRDGITLSLEEYTALVKKAKQGEEFYNPEETVVEKFEETIKEHKEGYGNNVSKFMFKNSHKDPVDDSFQTKEMSNPGFRSTASIGQVMGQKFILQAQAQVKDTIRGPGHVSLSEMLSEPRENVRVEKQNYVRRNKFGFIKKKNLPLTLR